MRITSFPLLSVFVITSAIVIAQPAFAASDFSVESSFEQATLGTAYRAPLRLNRPGNSRWTIVSGALPAGMNLYKISQDMNWSDAVLQGTPTEAGTFNFRVMAITPENTYMRDFSLVVFNPRFEMTPYWVVRGRVGLAYLQPLSTNGTVSAPLTWSISSGSLPAGLALRADTGEIVGTPTAAGTFEFTVSARDSAGRSSSRFYSTVIEPSTTVTPTIVPVEITTRSNPVNGRVGTAYPAQIFRARGGSGTFRWNMSGSIPPGLSMDASNGILSGTPTTAGTYTIFIKASDASNETNNQQATYTLVVDGSSERVIVTPPVVETLPSAIPTPSTPAETPAPTEFRRIELPAGTELSPPATPAPALTARQQALWNTFNRRWSTMHSRMHVSIAQLSDAMDEAPFNTLTRNLEDLEIESNINAVGLSARTYQNTSQAEMQALIRNTNNNLLQVGVLLRDGSRSWTPAERARATRIRNNLIQTRSSLTSALQAFTNFRRATPVR